MIERERHLGVGIEAQWLRDREAMAAAHRRLAEHPVLDFLWRRPWRANHRPRWSSARDVWEWMSKAHDCADPSVMCSCSGGFRYPGLP